jgi:phosphoglucosamine mutase
VIGDEPDGLNINDGFGSTHLEKLQAKVMEVGADFGIAHDGDADRALAVDHAGRIIDGDRIMAILALSMKEQGTLVGDTLVTTVMSNMGLRKAMEEHNITVRETAVGDRYVLEELERTGARLGGEQSGHVILTDHSTTGDGILTGLQLAREVLRTGRTLAELADQIEIFPQVLRNVPGVDRSALADNEVVQSVIGDASRELGDSGRVMVRASGTEALIRVMVEASDQATAERIADQVADVISVELVLP